MTNNKMNGELLAHDFRLINHGKLEEEKIAQGEMVLKNASNEASYHANGSVASMIFYFKFQVNIDDGKSFNGQAGGVASPGGGALIGDVYTDDIQRLYRDTVSFEFNCTPVYTSILFFDGHSNLLGHFQAGAVSVVAGVGGGSGKWE